MKALLLASALLAASATAQCALSDFGRPCGGDLTGSFVRTPRGAGLSFQVTGAMPDALAILVLGHQARTPHPLPGSQCLLLLDPRHTMLARTSPRGGRKLPRPEMPPEAVAERFRGWLRREA